jgi:hypothetical protein
MNAEPLVNAIVCAMMMMEDSGPDEINPDTAERCLENMGYELMQLRGGDREEFLALLERMANEATDERTSRFIGSIPFSIGMVEE